MAVLPALLLRNLAQTDGLVVAHLQRLFGLEEQPAEPHALQQVSGEEEEAGDYAAVVVRDVGGDDVGGDGDCEQEEDEEVGVVVPAGGEACGALGEVADDAAWGRRYRSSATRKAMNISAMAARW